MSEDITNKVLGKIFSVEFMAILVVGGMAWGSQTESMKALASEVDAVEARSAERAETDAARWREIEADTGARREQVNQIEKDVAVVKSEVGHVKDIAEQNQESIKEVLKIVREQYRAHQ